MHRDGHFGIVLLVLAPVLYVLFAVGCPLLALFACSVIIIEPLPDNDFWIPGLSHRGTSHSLFAAGVVGVCCAGLGWVIGTYLTVPVATWLITSILVDPAAIAWVETHLLTLDAGVVALVGFGVGSWGIVLHLAGDVITVAGIRPFLPFSRRRVSLSSLRAKNPLVDRGLFGIGVLAMIVVGLGLTPLGAILIDVLSDMGGDLLSRW